MSRAVIQCGWDDVPHLRQEDIESMIKGLPPHEIEARRKGVPSLGSGAIYPIPEEDILCEPFSIPPHFAKAYGMDVGWKMTTAIWGAYDRDNDIIYAYSEHGRGQAEPIIHATAIKARGAWINGIIDTAARGRSQVDGKNLFDLYEEQGLILNNADKAVEAGLLEVYQRLSTGRLKLFNTLQGTRSEYRIYRRDDKGHVVKENDHYMDALRYLVMGIEHATTEPIKQQSFSRVGDSYAGY